MCFGIPEDDSHYTPFTVAPEDRPCAGLLAMPSGNPALPLTVPSDSPPLLLQHGLADVTVPAEQSKEFVSQRFVNFILLAVTHSRLCFETGRLSS